ncbi:MAG TPA: beta-phosphoglucomutase family hydrolase [Solirubrobacterales bacterium]|nr:beta-phosphoglucomutase family hydrolase [Solirubrobacterales bacterium]
MTEPKATPLDDVDAVIFDLDGVVTDTAAVHAAAWSRVFDRYLSESAPAGADRRPFDADVDYKRYVDGRGRYDGVDGFLRSRGIELAWGEPADPPGDETVCALGNRKNEEFTAELADRGVNAFPSSVALVRELQRRGIPTAVISASRNCVPVLRAAGIEDAFDVKVDGVDMSRRGLPGKPDPAIFAEAAKELGVEPSRAAVVEDALAGVEAGRRGGFGLVVGVARDDRAAELLREHSDVVVDDLAALAWVEDGNCL